MSHVHKCLTCVRWVMYTKEVRIRDMDFSLGRTGSCWQGPWRLGSGVPPCASLHASCGGLALSCSRCPAACPGGLLWLLNLKSSRMRRAEKPLRPPPRAPCDSDQSASSSTVCKYNPGSLFQTHVLGPSPWDAESEDGQRNLHACQAPQGGSI